MRIAVDAGVLGGSDQSLQAGVYISAVNLFQELKKLDKRNEYLFYSFDPIDPDLLKSFPVKSTNIVLSSTGWLYFWLPLAFLIRRPDVFLAISQAMPVFHPFKTLGFIHGLDFISKFHKERTSRMKGNTEYLIDNSEALITTSTFLKEEIVRKYKGKNVHVVPLGSNTLFSKKLAPHKEPYPYFLFVGTLKVSKNIPNILKSFAIFQKKTNQKYLLLVIGSNFWLDQKIQQTIRTLHLENNIKLVPSVPPRKLVGYYKGAKALVSPSLYEGFGLPMVEAMTAGCPVIASNVGAIPEVVGDAALLSDPMDIKKIAKHMELILKDRKLRSSLIRKGYRQAKKYSWENFARQVLAIIKSL